MPRPARARATPTSINTHPVAALDTLATRKAADYIRKSLIEPNADIAEGYPLAISPMPPMNLLPEPQEIEDILAYLQTLK